MSYDRESRDIFKEAILAAAKKKGYRVTPIGKNDADGGVLIATRYNPDGSVKSIKRIQS